MMHCYEATARSIIYKMGNSNWVTYFYSAITEEDTDDEIITFWHKNQMDDSLQIRPLIQS